MSVHSKVIVDKPGHKVVRRINFKNFILDFFLSPDGLITFFPHLFCSLHPARISMETNQVIILYLLFLGASETGTDPEGCAGEECPGSQPAVLIG